MAAHVAAQSHHFCDLCGMPSERIEIDHDHDTDRIRGYVCRRCNFLLGVASDDPELLAKVIAYLADPPRDGSYREAVRLRRNAWAASDRQRANRTARNKRWRENHRKVNGQWVKIS